jgi:hypothetical protein
MCSRMLYAYKTGELVKTFDNTKALLLGHYVHELIEYIVRDELGFAAAEAIERREKIERNGWRASGRIDIAPLLVPNFPPFVVDIKTMNSRDFNRNQLPAWAYSYIGQIQLYMDWTGIPDSFLLVMEKDSPHKFKEINVKYNKDLVNSIYTRWDIVKKAIDEGIPPPHDLCIEDGTSCIKDSPSV